VVGYEISLDSWSISPSMSIGVAAATPGATPDDLVRSADVAMYSAKRAGKRRVHAYEQQMLGASSDALELQNDLKFALERDELALYFQPTIEIESGMVNGVEALLRWRHPVRGSVAPDQFIPLAEAGGTINAIGRWVIEQACSAAAALQQGSDRSIQMSVNLSPRQLHDPTICQVVRDAIAATGIDPALLVFEVTEGELLDDGLAIRRLRDLRALGVRIAIDDFGTGYTSINYLQSLPVDILKIDRAFVSGDALEPDERNAFLSALVSLARSLDLTSVAEGIEAPDQLADLKRLGCDVGQGFYWSPAMPMDELQARIASINGHTGSLVPASGTAG
jgi:EAL domain-containing protein (putative c-di-GMP-specific phosphodiesterase class I)